VELIRRLAAGLGALGAYLVTALIFHWPLPARLGSALTGPVSGDTGTYVWNLWVFRHEIVEHRRFPLSTQEILSLTPGVDLGLHNYTLFADVLAFPMIPFFGVTATFNVIYLGMAAFTAWAMYLLARKVIGQGIEAWLAGLLFGFSPILVARSTAHFSLVAAAPLPVFVLCLLRLEERPTLGRAIAAGATIAWAATCDPYFAVYCLMIAVCFAVVSAVRVHRSGGWPAAGRTLVRILDWAIVMALALVITLAIVINLVGIAEARGFGRTLELSLHAPVVGLMVLAIVRLLVALRPALDVQWTIPPAAAVRAALAGAAACALLLSPVLFVIYRQLTDGGALHGPIYWRSGPAGVDLLAFFTPNPANKLIGAPWRAWLTSQNNGYVENAAALTVVAMVLVGFAFWRDRFRPPRFWTAMTLLFGALALGPFIHVGGVNSYVLGPWALLRYLPIISAARMPARFAIVLMMAFAIVFGLALAHVTRRRPERRPLLLALVAALLAFELAPLPRRLHAAEAPDIYQIIAGDPRNVRVMGIPLGVSDGEGGLGRHDGASQFYQTIHQKPIVGGGLSRVPPRARLPLQKFRVPRVLLRLSEGQHVSPRDIARARRLAPGFIRRTRLGYVVIDTLTASPELKAAAIDILRLEKIAESRGRELYRPTGTGETPPLQ
jgi:hypothetical protein